jgi:hypothetical protein
MPSKGILGLQSDSMKDKRYTTVPLPAYVFWDVERDNLDLFRDGHFIISRMFERGRFDDVLTTIIYYGKEETGRVLQNNKYLNREGIFLAHALLAIPLQGFKAYGRFR